MKKNTSGFLVRLLEVIVYLALIGAIVVVGIVMWPGPQIRAEFAARDKAIANLSVQVGNLNTKIDQLGKPAATEPPVVTTVPSQAPADSTQPTVQASVTGQRPSELFITPVKCESSFNEASAWMVCEPGVLLDASTAWTIPGTKEAWSSNVPEGGFTYYSLGQGKITIDGVTLDLPYKEGHNYLVLVRGRIDDGKVDTDRNLTAEVTDFVPGHAIWSHMPKGAYVSKDWFRQQLDASTTESFTNCGALGCSNVTVVLFDADTHFEQRFEVSASNVDVWTQSK